MVRALPLWLRSLTPLPGIVMSTPPRDEAAIFNAARQIDDHNARRVYLEVACGEDRELLRRVEALLRVNSEKLTLLDAPTMEIRGILSATIRDEAGTQIGPYKLVQMLGEGGMGTVFRAEQAQPIHREVAVKIIRPGMDSRQVLARFAVEQQALALMDHPNIARVLDAGTTETARPYFVMELITGVPINKYCDTKHLTLRERLQLFIPVCQAVQHAHQKGIIHRDIKPSNVLVALYDSKPVPKVIDFGIAKATGFKPSEQTVATELGSVVGTMEYMSPEQAEPGQIDIDTRSDIYSLGVVLYELLTGSTPLQPARLNGAALLDLLRLVREEEPPKPSTRLSTTEELPSIAANRATEPKKLTRLVQGELDWIVMKCLEKDRTRRYATAGALASDIERYLHDEPVEAGPPATSYRLRKFAQKNRKLLFATGVFVSLLTAGVVVSTWLAVRAWAAEREATNAFHREADERKKAEKAAAESAAVLKFFRDRVLAAPRPKGLDGGLGADVTIRAALDKAEPGIAKTFADQPLIEASIRHTLAQSYSQLGEPKLAIPQQERALALLREHRGEEHPDTLGALNNLAIMLVGQNETKRARELFARAVELKKRVMGPDDPDTLRSMTNLATLLHALGEYDESRKLFEAALPIQERVLEEGNFETIRTMNNYAIVLQAQEHLDDARKMFDKALRLEQKYLPPDHPQTLATMVNLASLLEDLGQFDEAHTLLQRTLESQKHILPLLHPDVLKTRNNMAYLLHAQEQWSASQKMFEDTLKDERKVLPAGHPEMLRTMINLSWLLATTPDPSVRDHKRALELVKEMAPYAQEAGSIWTTSGAVYYRNNEWKNAISALEKYEPEMTGRYVSLNGFFLAMSYWQLGAQDKARQWYDKAITWMDQNLPKDRELLRIRTEAAQLLGLPAPPSAGKDGK
jgi:serine/threonine protein kinase/Tfp pilus assembly protein PilF